MQIVFIALRWTIPLVYLAVSAAYIIAFVKKRPPTSAWLFPVFCAGLLAHTALLAFIFLHNGNFSIQTPFQGLAFCAWVFCVIVAAVVYSQKETGFGAFLFSVGFIVTAVAVMYLNHGARLPQIEDSKSFFVHTWLLFGSYACFLLSAITSAMYLLQHRQIRTRSLGSFYERLPSLEIMDRIVTRADAVGAALLLFGIVTGFLWLYAPSLKQPNLSPKIAFALLTAVIYSCEHILRMGKGWKGQRACIVSLSGFALVILTLLVGRHGF
jgi:ABC-type uncharacterized transport system permease subunit